MSVIIVGHGPSLMDAGLGKEIDAFDVVIRFSTGFDWQVHKDYGSKYDVIVTSYQYMADLLNHNLYPKETWLFSRPSVMQNQYNRAFVPIRLADRNARMMDECSPWMEEFQKLNPEGYRSERHPDEAIFSTGLAAIIGAAHNMPGDITAGGFDALLSGDNTNHIAKYGERPRTAYHDFAAEKKLLTMVLDRYKCKLKTLPES